MKDNRPTIPVFPTLPPSALLKRGDAGWKKWFPFSSPAGMWAFSGRVALYHGLPILKLPPKSTILFPSYFQGVEIDTLLAADYRLRFYRIDENLNVDLEDVERRLDGEVSALYIIHYFGFPQPLAPILDLCQEKGLKLIEDCALSLFSRDGSTRLGSNGDLALFSVYKTVPIPHGGFLLTKGGKPSVRLRPAPFMSTLIATKDLIHQNLRASGLERLDDRIASVTSLVRKSIGWHRKQTIGAGGASWDPRLLEYNASFWAVHLMRLMDPETVITRRRHNFELLASRLRGRFTAPFLKLPAGVCPLFFPIMVRDKLQFQQNLAQLRIESVNLWYEPHPACPPEVAREVSGWRDHLLELPIHQGLTEDDVNRVADAVISIQEKD